MVSLLVAPEICGRWNSGAEEPSRVSLRIGALWERPQVSAAQTAGRHLSDNFCTPGWLHQNLSKSKRPQASVRTPAACSL